MQPERGYEALRRFRSSLPQADYFITLCTDERGIGLTNPAIAIPLKAEITAIEHAGYWSIRAAVIMPDHVHFLLTLHDKAPLGRAIARLKSKSKPSLAAVGLGWQQNYYEHRLRGNESVETVVRYVFLNPYRANLISISETFPWLWLGAAESNWFKPLLDNNHPFPEWLR